MLLRDLLIDIRHVDGPSDTVFPLCSALAIGSTLSLIVAVFVPAIARFVGCRHLRNAGSIDAGWGHELLGQRIEFGEEIFQFTDTMAGELGGGGLGAGIGAILEVGSNAIRVGLGNFLSGVEFLLDLMLR